MLKKHTPTFQSDIINIMTALKASLFIGKFEIEVMFINKFKIVSLFIGKFKIYW